ncbi:chromosome segregation protein SMC [Candidatus Woesearchaeota archaeon]|nr:chromosome segregation protein SMC [Candidatus Woesearchaeota archaeon]
MVKINRMVMQNFKSFAKKTELIFNKDFNCIIGPNGSGKSNVTDALCFVLGKLSTKGMRAERTTHLIYNGGKNKKPADWAKVSLYIDNKNRIFPFDTKEVKITRILKRKEKENEEDSAQGVYRINEKTSTRQEILELLAAAKINPDGYNIILQGNINTLIEMSSVERRGIIEQIAGIGVYEERKGKALRELEKVEKKINEANIILEERGTYLDKLKKERDQALKFKDLKDKIKRNKATLVFRRLEDNKKKSTKQDNEIQKKQSNIDKINEEITNLKEKLEKKKEEISKINKKIEEKGEKEQVEIHREVENMKVDMASSRERIHNLKDQIVKIKERKAELKNSLDEIKSKIVFIENDNKKIKENIDKKDNSVREIEKNIEDFQKEKNLENLDELNTEIEENDKKTEKLQEEIEELRKEQQELLRKKDRLEIYIENIDSKILKISGIKEKNKKQLNELETKKKTFKEISAELNTLLTEDSSLDAQLKTARGKLESKKEELTNEKSKHASISRGIAGSIAVTRIIEQKENNSIKGIKGTIGNLGKVNEEYSLALEVAAGSRIKSIVVENDNVAAECIDFLKKRKIGVANFLPLNKLRETNDGLSKEIMKQEGVIGKAIDLIDFDPKLKKAFSYVFGNTIIVKNVETARRIGIGKIRMVTIEGDLIEKSGAMVGGYRTKTSHGMGFRKKEVSENIELLNKEIDELNNTISKLKSKKEETEDKIQELREKKAELEGEVIKLEKSLHIDSEDLSATKDEKDMKEKELKETEYNLGKLMTEISEKNKEITGMKTRKQTLRDKVNNLRSPEVLAEMRAFEDKRKQLKEDIIELNGNLKNNISQIENVLGPEKENIEKILKQQEKEMKEFDREKESLDKEIGKKEKTIKEKEKLQEEFHKKFRDLFEKRSEFEKEISNMENSINNKQDNIRNTEIELNKTTIEDAQIKAKISGLEEEFSQYKGIEIFKDKPENKIVSEINKFGEMVENIGTVNMKALEIYEKVEVEFEVLKEKKNSLTNEKDTILVMINKIDTKKKELFMETFDVLNKNFKIIFSKLSSKGDAFLELEDENYPFNAGINIKVRIKGKKFLDIFSLSGGEKTLTALAFLFAVQEYDPAPFYVLDEVDAALDKRNSERLAKLIKAYSSKAQYIIVTHNDSIISECSTIYGVSMGKENVSKVTSLEI